MFTVMMSPQNYEEISIGKLLFYKWWPVFMLLQLNKRSNFTLYIAFLFLRSITPGTSSLV
ncbi:hypothetical protein DN752_21270 [Echinicola strongylocentroti]|uniref:Uncharacterized protein n=1 Tax=Echinicola strongylocentroti TaxID=1795355 RepID=A0A2Z4IMZ1_9BACT|nr:hypothetical protein DN752_21270 [Echinicola strongylocentroti]